MSITAARSSRGPFIITCAGPEGCGKSTNQKFIAQYLNDLGLRTAAVRGDRLTCGHAARRIRDRLRGKPAPRQYAVEAPTRESSDGVRRKAVTNGWQARIRAARRCVCYVVDSLLFQLYVRSIRGVDVLVFDRSAYDNLAKVVEYAPAFVRLIRKISVRPDLAILLTASPDDLVRRRPRSSRAYHDMAIRRYDSLSGTCPELVRISVGDLQETHERIRSHIETVLCGPSPMQITSPERSRV